jgi:hypothetical protein
VSENAREGFNFLRLDGRADHHKPGKKLERKPASGTLFISGELCQGPFRDLAGAIAPNRTSILLPQGRRTVSSFSLRRFLLF